MGTDRFIYVDTPPDRKQVEDVIIKSLDGLIESLEWDKPTYFVVIRGRAHLTDDKFLKKIGPAENEEELRERWVEVYIDPKYIDVITRMADEATSGLATALAYELVRKFNGQLRMG